MTSFKSLLDSLGPEFAPPPQAAVAPCPTASVPKRKAEDELSTVPAKRPITPSATSNSDVKRVVTTPDAQRGAPSPLKPGKPGNVKYAGSARQSGVVKAAEVKKSEKSQPVPKLNGHAPKSTSSLKGDSQAQKSTTLSSSSTPTKAEKSAPKPGSYAAMMARAKATQASKPVVGAIVHKQTEKVRRERTAEAAKPKGLPVREKAASDRSRTASAELATSKAGGKDKRKQNEITYRGTAKPVTSTYKGSAMAFEKRPPKRGDGYVDWSDLDEADDDEEDDYGSGSDDMEAGAFDIEHEEELSLREAKKADAEELARENAHKAEKLKRMQALQKLSDAAKKKKSVY